MENILNSLQIWNTITPKLVRIATFYFNIYQIIKYPSVSFHLVLHYTPTARPLFININNDTFPLHELKERKNWNTLPKYSRRFLIWFHLQRGLLQIKAQMSCAKRSSLTILWTYNDSPQRKRQRCSIQNQTQLFWGITQTLVVISTRRFGITYRSHLEGSRLLMIFNPTKVRSYQLSFSPVNYCMT
jgi:Uncharacterized protein conserved in bacteria, putative virulence factor